MKLLNSVYGLFPQSVREAVRSALGIAKIDFGEEELGEFVLREAIEFSKSRSGSYDAIQAPQLRDAIGNRQAIKLISEAYQFLLTALMRDYERDLYSFYKQQEVLIMLAFLSYPFRGPGSLRSNIEPVYKAASIMSELRILDYGAGIPYGIVHILRNKPEAVSSITLVDFDLAHTEFVEFLIRRLAPTVELTYIRLNDSEDIPVFGQNKFNVLFGKDIFEHVHEPGLLLETMLRQSDDQCIACLDINDHGEKYLQHVSPVLSPLLGSIEKHGFERHESVGGISIFLKNEAGGSQPALSAVGSAQASSS